jgi:hypothetical protein
VSDFTKMMARAGQNDKDRKRVVTSIGEVEYLVDEVVKERIAELEAELGNSSEAFCEAIEFAINTDEPRIFLQNWNEGEWGVLAEEWPEFKIHKSLTGEVTK